MTLPSSGEITLSMIRTELGKSGTISLNDTDVRALAGKTSGAISLSNFYGKSVWSVSVNDINRFAFGSGFLIGTMTATGAPSGSSYSWTKVSGNSSISINGSTTGSSASILCSTPGISGIADALFRCTVTKSSTSKSATGTATFEWEPNEGGGIDPF